MELRNLITFIHVAEPVDARDLDVYDVHANLWKRLICHKHKGMSKALRTVIDYIQEHEFPGA